MVMCTLVGLRCMWWRMGTLWCGVRGVGVVSVSGVYVATCWYSRAAPSCKAVGMSREGLWCRSRVACVVRMLRVRLGRWKDNILVLSSVRGVMSYSLCEIGCAVIRIVGGWGCDIVGGNG